MAFYKRNDCVGCDVCLLSCGRNKDYYVFVCDRCKKEFDEEEDLLPVGNMEVCFSCYDELDEAGKLPKMMQRK